MGVPQNVTGFYDLIVKTNTEMAVSGVANIIGPFIMLALFSISFVILMQNWDTKRALTGSFALCAIASVCLRIAGLLTNTWVFLAIVGAAVMVYLTIAYD